MSVESETVEQVTDQIWTCDRMEYAVRQTRRGRMRARLESAGVKPYAAE